MCDTQQVDKLIDFINTFGTAFDGQGCEANYARFTGVDRSTVNRIMNRQIEPNVMHYKVMELMTERNELKNQIRQMKRN